MYFFKEVKLCDLHHSSHSPVGDPSPLIGKGRVKRHMDIARL